MKLSIIIPYFNTRELTEKLLNVLLPQITDDVEVILIDDGCDETSLEKYPIKVIHAKNGGVSKARNIGLENTTGDFCVFVDSDDLVSSDYIDSILSTIKNKSFDYCYFGWSSCDNKLKVITDPPPWNTSVWNCIYKRSLIGLHRFDETKQIGEDLEFNKHVRKGKKLNIPKVLYYYNNTRGDSLTKQYQKGTITREVEMKCKIIVYRSFLSLLGGIETAIYNLCNELKHKYDITFLYDKGDDIQLLRLRKIVNCVKFEDQEIDCDIFIQYGYNPEKVIEKVQAKEYIQQICCDINAIKVNPKTHPKITQIYADSYASAKSFMSKYPRLKCGVLHNVFSIPDPKRVLNLMTASRLSWEKGYDRMKAMAKRMHELNIPFSWEVFTNDRPNEDIDGMIFRKPRLNVRDYMHNKDYGVQLSETESWCCTASEFLLAGVPMILTDFPSASEQIQDGVNGYILNRDLINLDSTIQNMYENKLPKPNFTIDTISEWTNILGKGSRSKYKYESKNNTMIKAIRSYYDVVECKNIRAGEVYEATDERARVLQGDNAQNIKFAERL